MMSTSRVLLLFTALGVLPLSACKTLPFRDKTPDAPPAAAAASPTGEVNRQKTPAKQAAAARSASADPYVVATGQPAAETGLQTLPASEESAANIGGLATQPTGIKAGQASIFSTGVAAADPAAPRGADGAMLPATAYSPAPGVNATLYSVYGRGNAPTGAPLPQGE